MTCREKLKIDHPDCWRELLSHCPHDFGYLNPEYTPCYTLDCDMCWGLPLHYQDRVLYLCDRKQCVNCTYPTCKHTQDISHAVNFKRQEDATDPRRTPYFWYETSEDDAEAQNEEGNADHPGSDEIHSAISDNLGVVAGGTGYIKIGLEKGKITNIYTELEKEF